MRQNSDSEERRRDQWVHERGKELRMNPQVLVEELDDKFGGQVNEQLIELITASRYGACDYVIDKWINMVIQDEDARGEWRE